MAETSNIEKKGDYDNLISLKMRLWKKPAEKFLSQLTSIFWWAKKISEIFIVICDINIYYR